MRKVSMPAPKICLHLEIDQKLGGLLRQAIDHAMPSETVFEEIWQSLRDRLQNPDGENQRVGLRLREFI